MGLFELADEMEVSNERHLCKDQEYFWFGFP